MMCGITGTPGTGKSMIGKALAARGYTVVHLTGTVQNYVIGMDEGRDTQVIDTERWAADFSPVNGFVEGHFAHLLPCDKIVILRCRPDELVKRLQQRKYRPEKIRENADAEALDVCLIETVERYDPVQILELDTTGKEASSSAGEIERFYKGEIRGVFGDIDWSAFLGAGQ